MPDRMVAKASAIAYGLPLMGLLTGMLAGYAVSGGKDVPSLTGAALGLAVSLLGDRFIRKKEDWV